MMNRKWQENISGFFKKSRLSQNTGQKIISILFALLFWLYVMDQVNPEMVRDLENVKVELLNRPQTLQNGLILMDEQDHFVNVKIKGRRNNLFSITNEDIRVTADLEGYGKGNASIPLETRVLSGNYSVADLSQKEIKVFLDRVVEISKPINIQMEGTPKKGYVRGELSFSPQEVFVKGPESYVNTVASIQGELKTEGLTTGIDKEVPVKAVDNDGNVVVGVSMGKNYVRAHLNIWKGKTVSVKAQIKGKINPAYALVNISAAPAKVSVRGTESSLDGLNKAYTVPVDISGLTQSTEVQAELELPNGVFVPEAQEIILIKIRVEPIETKIFEIPAEKVHIENLKEGLVVEKRDIGGKISIVVKDVPSILDKLTEEDFYVKVDGQKLLPGVKTKVEVSIESQKSVRNISVGENTLVVPVRLEMLLPSRSTEE